LKISERPLKQGLPVYFYASLPVAMLLNCRRLQLE